MNKFDNLSMPKLLKQAQEMQKKLQDIQQKVAEMEITAQSGGGILEIILTGQHYAKKTKIDPAAFPSLSKEDRGMLEDLIVAAINDGTDKIERNLRDKMGGLAGLNLPTGFEEN